MGFNIKKEGRDDMKTQFIAYAALAAALAALGWNCLKKTPKVAYAETNVILSEFSEAIQARKKFEESQGEWDKNLKTLNDSLVAAMESMKGRYDAASKEEQRKMQAELQQRNEELQRYTNAVKKLAQDREKELMEPVIKKVNSFMDLWGKEHGYDLILGTMTGGNILQAKAQLNMTPLIIKDLNFHYRGLPSGEEKKVSSPSPAKSDQASSTHAEDAKPANAGMSGAEARQ